MQRRSLIISVGLHLGVVLAATLTLPFLKRDFVIPPPLSVEIVNIDELTQTDKIVEEKPQPPKPEKEKPEPKKPPPAAQNKSETPVAPPKPDPKKDQKPKPPKKTAITEDPNAPPDKKKDKKKEEKPNDPADTRDFSSVLKNLAETKDTTPEQKPQTIAPLGQRMSMSEMDALRGQLEACWNIPIGAKEAEDLNIEILMTIGPDRILREAHVVDSARYNNDSFFRAAADSALRAVRSPLCSPFELPPDKYNQWKEITVNFNPSEMF